MIHVIPDDDLSSSSPSTVVERTKRILSDNNERAALMKQASAPSSSVFMFQDAIGALRDSRSLTHTAGNLIVLNQAVKVHNRLLDYQERSQNNVNSSNKRRRIDSCLSTNNDIVPSSSSATHEEDSISSMSSDVEEAEKTSIMNEANRVKHITMMFRNIDRLQGILMRELHDCLLNQQEQEEEKGKQSNK